MESLADTQFIDLGIRGVQRRIRGAKIQTLVTNIIGRLVAVGVIVWVSLQFADLIDFTNVEKFPDGHLLDSLTLIFIFFENIALVIFTLPLMIFLAFGGIDANAIMLGARAFITVDLFNNVSPPGEMTATELYGVGDSAINALFSPFGYFFSNLAPLKAANRASVLVFFILLFAVAVAAFLLRADMRSATAAFVCIQLVVFYGSVQLLFKSGFSFSPTRNFGELIMNEVVLIALASYLFLEIALQISYIQKIFNPAQSRQERVLRALDRLKDFRLGITGSAPVASPVEEIEEGDETEEDGKKKKKKGGITGTGSSISRKFGVAGLTYFMEKASDSLFARPGGQRDKLTARLQRYHDGLVHSDSKVDDKLVGASISVTPFKTLMYVGISIIFRVGIMLGGLYAILNPDILLFFLRYPPSVYNSLEMLEPEGVVLLLIPIVIFILLFTSLIGFIQEKFSARVEQELEPILEDMDYMEDDRTGIISEEEVIPISEEDVFYEQLASEFDDSTE